MKGPPDARQVLTDPVQFLAFGFGAGLSPWAPGTAGSLVGVAAEMLLRSYGAGWPLRLGLTALVCFAGIWLCGECARRLGEHDHPGIVWDEIAGIMVAMLAAPPGWKGLAAGFVLFRIFDVLKPWPVSLADRRVRGGAGIMLDDILAALYTIAALLLLVRGGVL